MTNARWLGHVKATNVESCLAIEAASLARDGAFASGCRGRTSWMDQHGREVGSVGWHAVSDVEGLYLRLGFVVANRGEDVEQAVRLDRTYPPVGGVRWWFRCPGSVKSACCNRRVGKLYLAPGGSRFACRHCLNLTYRSAQEHDARRDPLRRDPVALLEELRRPKPSLVALEVALRGFM